MWLACSCAMTVGEHAYLRTGSMEDSLNVLECHINTQCLINQLSPKDSDYVLEHGTIFFKERVAKLIDDVRNYE